MKYLCVFSGALLLAAAGSFSPAQPADARMPLSSLSDLVQAPQSSPDSGPEYDLESVERIALSENPELHLAARRVAMAEAHLPLAGALDDPQAMYRGWGVPLSQPWNYNAAQNMFMIGQQFPGRGKRDLRTSIAQSDVDLAKDELASARLRVQVEVRKAFYDLLRAQDELRVHDQHVDIADQAIQAAKIKYTVGKIPQVEILKAQVALTRLAEHMIRFERDADVARAHLNTLLGRSPDAPLRIHGEYGLARNLPPIDAAMAAAMQARPDLQEAAAALEKSRREKSLAGKTYAPDFNVAAGYMLMAAGSDTRNNYMLEGSVTLPWLNRHKHDAEIAEASASTAEKDAELDSMRNSARGQIQEALAEAKAAQRLARVYQDSLRPQAEQTLHSAVVAYENDQTSFLDLLDSQMTVVDVDLAWIDALGEFNNRIADLELAMGAPMEDLQSATKEETK